MLLELGIVKLDVHWIIVSLSGSSELYLNCGHVVEEEIGRHDAVGGAGVWGEARAAKVRLVKGEDGFGILLMCWRIGAYTRHKKWRQVDRALFLIQNLQ